MEELKQLKSKGINYNSNFTESNVRSFSSLSVSPNVRSPVLRFGMEQDGGQENWDALWKRYQESVLSSEKTRILFGMARTRHVWLLARYDILTEVVITSRVVPPRVNLRTGSGPT